MIFDPPPFGVPMYKDDGQMHDQWWRFFQQWSTAASMIQGPKASTFEITIDQGDASTVYADTTYIIDLGNASTVYTTDDNIIDGGGA